MEVLNLVKVEDVSCLFCDKFGLVFEETESFPFPTMTSTSVGIIEKGVENFT